MELFDDDHHQPLVFPYISSSLPAAAAAAAAATTTNPASADASPLMDVVAALEHATMSAKRLSVSAPSTAAADSSEAASAIVSLRNAHQVIGSFLSRFEPRPPPVDAAASGGDEPMSDGTEAVEAAEDADASSDVGEVEEGIRECELKSKRRRKRPVPPCWPASRMDDDKIVAADPVDHRWSAMDLVFQFHG